MEKLIETLLFPDENFPYYFMILSMVQFLLVTGNVIWSRTRQINVFVALAANAYPAIIFLSFLAYRIFADTNLSSASTLASFVTATMLPAFIQFVLLLLKAVNRVRQLAGRWWSLGVVFVSAWNFLVASAMTSVAVL